MDRQTARKLNNEKRQATRKLTKEKRQGQTCKVFELKIDKSHLSKSTIAHLNNIFKEAKWFYNYCISLENVNNADYKARHVPVKVGDNFEERDLTVLSSQMKQGIKARTLRNLKVLSSFKKKGKKVGRLKFKSFVNSVPLVQLARYKKQGTYAIDKTKSRIGIQRLKKWIRVKGFEQIKDGVDIANANLIRKRGDFFLQLTTFEDKQEKAVPDTSIGIDFGCQTQLTLSNGIKVEFQVPISNRLKRLDRKIDKKVNGKIGRYRGSKNRRKLQAKRRKEHGKIVNKKKDIRHKIVSCITKNFKYVCVQDESIAGWRASGHGKKIQNSGIGGILCDLKHKSHTPIVVDKFFPSTQLCPQCDKKNKFDVSERTYECSCGFKEDRDLKSARCIETEGMKQLNKIEQIPTDHRNFKLEEKLLSTCFDSLMKIDGIKTSMVISLSQEAPQLAVG